MYVIWGLKMPKNNKTSAASAVQSFKLNIFELNMLQFAPISDNFQCCNDFHFGLLKALTKQMESELSNLPYIGKIATPNLSIRSK